MLIAPGTDAGYVGGAQTYMVNGVPYIYALTKYEASVGNQFNRWQIDPATGLIPTTNTVVANVSTPAVVESVTYGKDGTNPNYLYITSTNSQGASVIWPQTVVFDLSTNTIVNSGTDLQGGYNGNPAFHQIIRRNMVLKRSC
ncbi:MAG: hypothetical protein IPG48_08740 [Saprospiraceae bacterium]|nr:hypothetical protein [Saprospiraceae bacterium]